LAKTVYVVHCIDTEGPLHESVDATFERLKAIFKLDLEPSVETLRRLQAGEMKLGGLEAAVRKVVDPHLLAYNDTWDKVDAMLAELLSEPFRGRVRDSFGTGWIYSWFCLDHVDYENNPRRRDIGYHNVYDHYRGMLRVRKMACIFIIIRTIFAVMRIAARRIGGLLQIASIKSFLVESSTDTGFPPRTVRDFTSSARTVTGF